MAERPVLPGARVEGLDFGIVAAWGEGFVSRMD